MNVLVIGGTRFFGIHMVNKLLENGHQVTIATRGNTVVKFNNSVDKIIFDRNNDESIKKTFLGKKYDIVIDKIAPNIIAKDFVKAKAEAALRFFAIRS